MIILCLLISMRWRWLMTTVTWVILVGPVFGGRCGAEALGLGLGLSPGPAYRFALPPGLAAKTTRCLVFDQGRPTSHLHCHGSHTFDPFVFASAQWILFPSCFIHVIVPGEDVYRWSNVRLCQGNWHKNRKGQWEWLLYMRVQLAV